MIFLIEYDRSAGTIRKFRDFADSEMPAARKAQFDLEIELSRIGKDHEVALLEAENEAAVRRTHRRYFEDLPALLKSAQDPSAQPGEG